MYIYVSIYVYAKGIVRSHEVQHIGESDTLYMPDASVCTIADHHSALARNTCSAQVRCDDHAQVRCSAQVRCDEKSPTFYEKSHTFYILSIEPYTMIIKAHLRGTRVRFDDHRVGLY